MEGNVIITGLTCVWKKISAMPWLTVLRLYLVSFYKALRLEVESLVRFYVSEFSLG